MLETITTMIADNRARCIVLAFGKQIVQIDLNTLNEKRISKLSGYSSTMKALSSVLIMI